MTESMISTIKSEIPGDGCVADTSVSASNESSATRHRKIEFHLARKPFAGIGNGDFQLETLNPTLNGSNSHKAVANRVPPSSVKKSDGQSEFFENGLDPELSFGITVRRIGAGLENLGNTCFLNSVLQCLTYTEPLAAYLQSGKHQTSCRVAGFCALCAIQKHVSRALQSTGRSLAPKDLVSNLRCISRNFRNARQEDAHEYMVNLLESMHKCCLPKGVPSESPSAYEKSLVHKIFGGRLRSQVKCMQCSYCSNTFDPFLDLSLEIAKADSLYKALAHFTAMEQLDGGEKQYQCQHCKQKVKALKQLTVYKVPYVLTIHLKRFRAHDPGQKIDKKVQFGPTLNLKPFVSGSYEGDLKYTLYGVLVHAGWNTRSGHYYCFIRTASGTWYSVDDNRVFPVGERTVLEQKAYMLFYYRERRNVGPQKPVHVPKENMAVIGLRNEMLAASNQGLKGAVQDRSFEKRFSGANTSPAVKRDELNVFSTKETQLKEESSVQKRNDAGLAKTIALKTDTDLKSPLPTYVQDPVEKISIINPEVEKRESFSLSPLVPPVKGSGDNSNLGNASLASTAIRINERKTEGNFTKDSSVSTTIQSNCKPHQKPAIENVVTDVILKKINTVSNRGVSSATQSRDDEDKTSGKIDPIISTNQLSNENSQVGSITNGSAIGLSDEKAADTGLKSSVSELIESSSSPIMLNGPLHMIAPDQKPHRRVKKKVLKCRLASMHLGSNILYGASLSLRKKKKHKLSTKRSLGVNNLTQEHLEEIDLEPSTSEKIRGASPASIHPRKKRVKSCSEDRHTGHIIKKVLTSVGDSLMDTKEGEFRERIDQYGAVPGTVKLPHKNSRSTSGLAVNQIDAREPDVMKDANRESMQNGLMSMVTRGLEETIVARWDGVDIPLSRDVESSAHGTVSIGYIPDEWDEEYDRGKRKKVRISQDNFDGPNPFQEIASKNARLKKAKMDRSSSGNQPFRI